MVRGLAHRLPECWAVKLLLLPAVLALAVLTGASGPGPLKDNLGSIFASRDELARGRAEIADLRQGRGAAAPAWLTQYANAICSHDAEYVETHTDAALGMTLDEVTTQFDTMHARGQDCTAVRYLGSVNEKQFIYVLKQGPKEVWYVFTLSDDGASVVNVE